MDTGDISISGLCLSDWIRNGGGDGLSSSSSSFSTPRSRSANSLCKYRLDSSLLKGHYADSSIDWRSTSEYSLFASSEIFCWV